MSETKKMTMDTPYIVRLAVTLLAITAVTALLLGIVNYFTAPVIQQIQDEKKAAAMSAVLQAEEYPKVEGFVPAASTSAAGTGTVAALYEAVQGGNTLGYVAEVTANGFGGAVSMVVGVTTDGAVTGVSVIDHSETQGVGSKVVNSQEVLSRFAGLSGEITVNSGENKIDGVSGATVSSKAVTAGVNAALAAVAAVSQ